MENLNELALFAGAGGGILGGKLLGWRTVCAVEIEDYPRRVLMQRQNDGILEPFPIWDDVTTFDGKPWQGIIDVVSGGFPCQDISCAGKGEGITGARSGLWGEMARIIGEVRPRFVFVENSPLLVSRGLTTVLGDLATLGFDAQWCLLSAAECGAPHRRERLWIVANANKINRGKIGIQPSENKDRRYSNDTRPLFSNKAWLDHGDARSFSAEDQLCRIHDGMAQSVDQYSAIGNGQVPIVAATAWRILTNE